MLHAASQYLQHVACHQYLHSQANLTTAASNPHSADAERQLVQCLQQSLSRIPELSPELGPLVQELSDVADSARAVQQQLSSQITGIQSVVRSIRSYGLANISDAQGTVAAVGQELAALKEDVQAELAFLSE